jgi:hypothetical protein
MNTHLNWPDVTAIALVLLGTIAGLLLGVWSRRRE